MECEDQMITRLSPETEKDAMDAAKWVGGVKGKRLTYQRTKQANGV